MGDSNPNPSFDPRRRRGGMSDALARSWLYDAGLGGRSTLALLARIRHRPRARSFAARIYGLQRRLKGAPWWVLAIAPSGFRTSSSSLLRTATKSAATTFLCTGVVYRPHQDGGGTARETVCHQWRESCPVSSLALRLGVGVVPRAPNPSSGGRGNLVGKWSNRGLRGGECPDPPIDLPPRMVVAPAKPGRPDGARRPLRSRSRPQCRARLGITGPNALDASRCLACPPWPDQRRRETFPRRYKSATVRRGPDSHRKIDDRAGSFRSPIGAGSPHARRLSDKAPRPVSPMGDRRAFPPIVSSRCRWHLRDQLAIGPMRITNRAAAPIGPPLSPPKIQKEAWRANGWRGGHPRGGHAELYAAGFRARVGTGAARAQAWRSFPSAK